MLLARCIVAELPDCCETIHQRRAFAVDFSSRFASVTKRFDAAFTRDTSDRSSLIAKHHALSNSSRMCENPPYSSCMRCIVKYIREINLFGDVLRHESGGLKV